MREVAEPKIQGNAEALVAPTAVAICDLDRPVAGGLFPVPGPFAFGHEFVGTVVEAGPEAGVQLGDEVVVSFQISCGECDRCQRGITGSCRKVNPGAMFGLGEIGGDWGGALSDFVRIPFARSMLFKSRKEFRREPLPQHQTTSATPTEPLPLISQDNREPRYS